MNKKQLQFLALVLTLLALGSILFAACSRPGTIPSGTASGSGSTPTTSGSSGGTTVQLGPNNFLTSSVTIPKGSSLTLIDTVAVPHIIANGTWNGGTAVPAKESGAPTVNVTFNGNDTKQIGPFSTAGTFKLYCTIHQAMNLTVIVK